MIVVKIYCIVVFVIMCFLDLFPEKWQKIFLKIGLAWIALSTLMLVKFLGY